MQSAYSTVPPDKEFDFHLAHHISDIVLSYENLKLVDDSVSVKDVNRWNTNIGDLFIMTKAWVV